MADDLMQMQRQAAHRVQQMQAHSRRVFETYQGRPPEPLGDTPWQQQLHSPGLYAHEIHDKPPCEHPNEPTSAPAPLRWDTEQWLLLGLALLLFRSGCRPELILALVYLAL